MYKLQHKVLYTPPNEVKITAISAPALLAKPGSDITILCRSFCPAAFGIASQHTIAKLSPQLLT